jgi:hypothetical protein
MAALESCWGAEWTAFLDAMVCGWWGGAVVKGCCLLDRRLVPAGEAAGWGGCPRPRGRRVDGVPRRHGAEFGRGPGRATSGGGRGGLPGPHGPLGARARGAGSRRASGAHKVARALSVSPGRGAGALDLPLQQPLLFKRWAGQGAVEAGREDGGMMGQALPPPRSQLCFPCHHSADACLAPATAARSASSGSSWGGGGGGRRRGRRRRRARAARPPAPPARGRPCGGGAGALTGAHGGASPEAGSCDG